MWRVGESSTMGTLQKISFEVHLKELRAKFEKAWSRDTCWHKMDFHPKVPSGGQCFVTAMIVQDIFGGDLIQGTVFTTTHYWNLLPNGREYDLTSDQFDGCSISMSKGDGIHAHPDSIRSNKFVNPNRRCKRYLLLKKRIVET